MIDRGPLWFPGFGNAMHVKRVFEELNRQFPKRFGRKRRILPEVEDGPSIIQKMLGQYGLERQVQEPYQTYWLGLEKDEDTLRAELKQKWRNSLNKAERQDLKIEWDFEGRHAAWMTGIYAGDKAARGYAGITPAFLKTYIPVLLESKDFALAALWWAISQKRVCPCSLNTGEARRTWWGGTEKQGVMPGRIILLGRVKMLKQHGIKELDLRASMMTAQKVSNISKKVLAGALCAMLVCTVNGTNAHATGAKNQEMKIRRFCRRVSCRIGGFDRRSGQEK